ncbi:response regulator transcription factor [bacterium AH-315-F18]|nr:response regulator transcription factor [bacterium AH-315-F18]
MHSLIRSTTDLDIFKKPDANPDTPNSAMCSQPDIVSLEICRQECVEFSLISETLGRHPGVPILVISVLDERLYAERAIQAGAMGYVTKWDPPTTILSAIRKILSGQVFLSEDVNEEILLRLRGAKNTRQPEVSVLTSRELEVLRCIGLGWGAAKTAIKLKIRPKTVDSHRANIMTKLRFTSAAQLREFAIFWGRGQLL